MLQKCSNHDLICICETWCLDSNVIKNCFPNYVCEEVSAKRFSKFGRAAGGVAVYYHRSFDSFFERICTQFNFGIVLKIKGKLFDVDNTVIILFVYFPPSSSPLYDIEDNGMIILEELLTEIRGTYSDCLFIVLGDLNARMGNLKDYICDDDAKYLNNMEWYVESKFSQSRNSKDKVYK